MFFLIRRVCCCLASPIASSTNFFNVLLFVYFQKTATAVAYCKRGCGLIRVNGRPLDQIEPKVLQYKLQEPILLLGKVSCRWFLIFFALKFYCSFTNNTPSTWWYKTYPEIDVAMKLIFYLTTQWIIPCSTPQTFFYFANFFHFLYFDRKNSRESISECV